LLLSEDRPSCDCSSPYVGEICEYSLTPAFFTPESLGWVRYMVTDTSLSSPSNKLDLSFRIKTSEENAFLAFIGDHGIRNDMYFMVRLFQGQIYVLLRKEVHLLSNEKVNDDEWHDVKIEADDLELSIYVDHIPGNTSYAVLPLNQSVSFSSDNAFIGGLPDLVKMLFPTQAG